MNEEFLKELLIISKAMDASPVEPSERANAKLKVIFERFAPSVISEKQMKILILKVLSKGRADGREIVEKLKSLKVHLGTEGDGHVFALLARMQDGETIIGQFNAEMTRKTYALSERGSRLLATEANTVQSLNPLVAGLWAV